MHTQSCLTLCEPMDCNMSGSSVHGIFQARILEQVAISFSRGSSWPRNWTQVFCIAGRFFTSRATGEAHLYFSVISNLPKSPTQLCLTIKKKSTISFQNKGWTPYFSSANQPLHFETFEHLLLHPSCIILPNTHIPTLCFRLLYTLRIHSCLECSLQ